MSLLIRKKCQPILDGVGLHDYYADMNSDKQLTLLTANCSKPFTVIPGVVFGRPHPTQAEIEFAADLLNDWVDRNESKIEHYLERFFTLDQTPVPENKIELPNKGSIEIQFDRKYENGDWVYSQRAAKVFLGPADGRTFTMTLEGHLWSLAWDNVWEGKWADLVKLDKKIMDRALDFINQHLQYKMLKKEVDDLAADLNLCKV